MRNPDVLFLSGEKLGIVDAQLTSDFRHGRTQLSLIQGNDNQLLDESSLLVGTTFSQGSKNHAEIVLVSGTGFRVRFTTHVTTICSKQCMYPMQSYDPVQWIV
jgi:hypothetical protein